MNAGNLPLVESIRAEIEVRGPQSFAWFMRQALYHSRDGYYASGRSAIGLRGDYFTNVSVSPLFGQIIAAQFAEIWERLDQIDDFVIVEQGAHHGEFARDLLDSARQRWPEFFVALRYQIVEPFSILQDRQSRTLAEFKSRVQWRRSLDEVEPFVGIHFSNELLDSMPVHLIISTNDGWRERFVGVSGDEFVFVDQPAVDQKLQAFLEKLPARPVGYQTEVNLAALDWLDNLAAKLTRGYVVAIDYGFSRDELYAPHRTAGTLQVRAQHRHLSSPFEKIGEADITAHVDWTSLTERAQNRGLDIVGFTDQHHFVAGIVSELLTLPEDRKGKRALQTLLHPEMLGRAFQALALGKGVHSSERLAGFKFARDARAGLGL